MTPARPPQSDLPEDISDFLSPADAISHRPVPRFVRATMHVMALALVVATIWASFATVEEIVYARGKITSVERTIVIQPLETSIIKKIHVREGQKIAKGQSLITLDPTFSGADLSQSDARWKTLESQKRRLAAELANKPFVAEGPDDEAQMVLYKERRNHINARLRSFDAQIAKIKSELDGTRRSAELLDERMKTASVVESMQKNLYDRELGSKLRYLGSQDQRLTVEHDLTQARDHSHGLGHELDSVKADRDAFLVDSRQKLTEELVSVSRDIDQVLDTMDKAMLRNKLTVITSPADGVVLEIAKRSVSSIVREAEQMITIMPADAPLEVDAEIDSSDIGLVNIDSPARVKVDTFPYQKYGTLPATVRIISMDSFNRDPNASTRSSDRGAFFTTRLTLGSQRLGSSEYPAILVPGMSVSAEIIIGRRSIMSYLLRPLTTHMDNALHEP
jgi:hemolysin D